MLLSSEVILNVLRQHKHILEQQFFVKRIGLFGSFARNEAKENSDIDFLVEFDAPIEIYISNRNAAKAYLQKTFDRSVDIANPHSLKPHFKQRILQQAIYA